MSWNILWEASKATNVLTDHESLNRFFQTKPLPPILRNPCEYVPQLIFKATHIAGSVNTTNDFLSRLELKVPEKIHLNSGRMYRQQPSRRQHLPQMFPTKNSFSSRNQMVKMKPKNSYSNEKSNFRTRLQNGRQTRVNPQRTQVSNSSQRLTETLHRIASMESKRKHEYESSKMPIWY